MDKNLPSSVLCVGGDKVKKRQAISYDWVPKCCSACKEFGHVVAECGGSKPRQQHEVRDGWSNNKKVGKEQQAYVPKAKNLINEVNGKLVPNTHKAGEVVGKKKHSMMDGGPKGAIYKTNLLNKHMETIKVTSANPFQLLASLEVDNTGDKVKGENKGNHKYFCSDDEVDDVDELAPWNETQMQNIVEAEEITNVEEVAISVEPLAPDLAIKLVNTEVDADASADDDSREPEARGSGKEIETELPMSFNQENQGSESDIENQDSGSEAEDEDSIQNYGKQLTECGMPPTLTVSNLKFQGEIDMPKENKKEKKQSTPALVRPACSRTTRHSFRVG